VVFFLRKYPRYPPGRARTLRARRGNYLQRARSRFHCRDYAGWKWIASDGSGTSADNIRGSLFVENGSVRTTVHVEHFGKGEIDERRERENNTVNTSVYNVCLEGERDGNT